MNTYRYGIKPLGRKDFLDNTMMFLELLLLYKSKNIKHEGHKKEIFYNWNKYKDICEVSKIIPISEGYIISNICKNNSIEYKNWFTFNEFISNI